MSKQSSSGILGSMANSEPSALDYETAYAFNNTLDQLEDKGVDTGPIRRTRRPTQHIVLNEIEERHDKLLKLMAGGVRLGAPLQADLEGVLWANRAAQEYEAGLQDQLDPLTGLPTGVFFEREMERELSQLERNQLNHGMLFLDLNGFKGVNSYYKEDMRYGDKIVKIFASALRECVRKGDLIARRQAGGDEFLVLLHDMDPALDKEEVVRHTLTKLFTTVRDKIREAGLVWEVNDPEGQPIMFEDDIPLFASFGLKMCRPREEAGASEVISIAYERMGEHKRQTKAGRGE